MSEHIVDKIVWTGHNIDEIRDFTEKENISYIMSMKALWLNIEGEFKNIPRDSKILKKSNGKLIIGACKCLSN